jgi:hypothetical protein
MPEILLEFEKSPRRHDQINLSLFHSIKQFHSGKEFHISQLQSIIHKKVRIKQVLSGSDCIDSDH